MGVHVNKYKWNAIAATNHPYHGPYPSTKPAHTINAQSSITLNPCSKVTPMPMGTMWVVVQNMVHHLRLYIPKSVSPQTHQTCSVVPWGAQAVSHHCTKPNKHMTEELVPMDLQKSMIK